MFLWQKVSFVAEEYSALAYVTKSKHISNDAGIQRDRDVLALKLEFRLWVKNTTPKKSQPLGFVEKAISSGTAISDFWFRLWKSLSFERVRVACETG